VVFIFYSFKTLLGLRLKPSNDVFNEVLAL